MVIPVQYMYLYLEVAFVLSAMHDQVFHTRGFSVQWGNTVFCPVIVNHATAASTLSISNHFIIPFYNHHRTSPQVQVKQSSFVSMVLIFSELWYVQVYSQITSTLTLCTYTRNPSFIYLNKTHPLIHTCIHMANAIGSINN